jgi:hypothetical protein
MTTLMTTGMTTIQASLMPRQTSIGRYQAEVGGLPQEILTWYDAQGNRHLSAEEQERQRTEKEQQARQRLEAYLRSQGMDPNHLPE